MNQSSQEKRRSSLRLALGIGALVLVWYLAAMFLVLQS